MPLRLRIPRLFDQLVEWFGGVNLPQTTKIDIQAQELEKKGVRITNLKELPAEIRESDDLSSVLDAIGRAIPSTRRSGVVDNKRIQVDSAALLMVLISNGYEPKDLLLLLGNIYGSIMGGAPDGDVSDIHNPVTVEELERQFFILCEKERIANKLLRGQVQGAIRTDTRGMN